MQSELAVVPQAYFTDEERRKLGRNEEGKLKKRGISIEDAQKILGQLDMAPHHSFYLLERECMDPSLQKVLVDKGKVLATAQMGSVSARLRSGFAMGVCAKIWQEFVPWGTISREDVVKRCESIMGAQGGTQNTLFRLRDYYPHKARPSGLRPVKLGEAREALIRSGINVPEEMRPLAFDPNDGDIMVSVNPDAENGYPYMGKWSDEQTHTPILVKAKEIQNSIERAYKEDPKDGVWRWLRQMEASPEDLRFVCVKGKCKADPYKKEKLVNRQMRFYNVFPRQVLLNIMRVTQVVDLCSQHATSENPRVKTAIGATLVRGGAERLVDALERSVVEDGAGYLHVGDDTWFVLEHNGEYHLFCVDCSSFDLTQRGEVTQAVHEVLRDEMMKIHPPSAQLWYAYARERCVTVVNSQVYRWKHGGPSGFPLQSKVNDMLMDVYCRRVIGNLADALGRGWKVEESQVERALKEEGEALGFTVRLEEYACVKASSLREALEKRPFKFIGFYFYTEDDRVYAVGDFPRQFAQMPYPNSFWVDKTKLLTMEAVRMAGIYISQGRPPMIWRPMFRRWQSAVEELLKRAIKEAREDSLSWLPDNAFVGVSGDDVASMKGLLNAVCRPWDVLWGFEGELEADTYLVGKEVQVGEDLQRVTRGIVPMKPPTHPLTMRNHGRPPPTVRWTPAKAPRQYKTVYEQIKGFRRQAGEMDYDERTEMSYDTLDTFERSEYDDDVYMDPDYYGFKDFTMRDGTVKRLWGRKAEAYEEYLDDHLSMDSYEGAAEED
ncbi:hypothetical protein 1 [Lactuca sativa narna-like virus]|nr:hypothetical protein 1 [Lactuca sativa narna-like virus]